MAQAVINLEPVSLHQSVMQGRDADSQTVRLRAACRFPGVLEEPEDPGTVGCPTITLTDGLPDSIAGAAYSGGVTATGGQAPYTYSLVSGSLPPGTSLNASTGAVTGTTTTPGTYTATLRAVDDRGCYGDVAVEIIVMACPEITLDDTLPDSSVGASYSGTILASGGTSPYTFEVTSGTLPTGLTLSPSGALTGTPTSADTFDFTVTATDSQGCIGSRAYVVEVVGPVELDCVICSPVGSAVLSFDSTGWPACCIPSSTTLSFLNCYKYYDSCDQSQILDFRWGDPSSLPYMQLIYRVNANEWFVRLSTSIGSNSPWIGNGGPPTTECWVGYGVINPPVCDANGFSASFTLVGIVGTGVPICDCTGLSTISVTI